MNEEVARLQPQFDELEKALCEIQQPRSNFVLRHFVVGQHDTAPRRYQQCLLELEGKRDNIHRAMLERRLAELELDALDAAAEAGDERAKIHAELKRIDLAAHERALLGAIRECETLFAIWKAFPHRYTHEELQQAEAEYWQKRLTRQAEQDIRATGRIGIGNQQALWQMGVDVARLEHHESDCPLHRERLPECEQGHLCCAAADV